MQPQNDAGRTIESISAGSGNAFLAEHHQYFSVRAQLQNFLAHDDAGRVLRRHSQDSFFIVDVGDPQVSITIDGESVRIGKQSNAETLQQLS